MPDILNRTTLMVRNAQRDSQWYQQVFGMIGLLEWLEPKLNAPPQLSTAVIFGAPIVEWN